MGDSPQCGVMSRSDRGDRRRQRLSSVARLGDISVCSNQIVSLRQPTAATSRKAWEAMTAIILALQTPIFTAPFFAHIYLGVKFDKSP